MLRKVQSLLERNLIATVGLKHTDVVGCERLDWLFRFGQVQDLHSGPSSPAFADRQLVPEDSGQDFGSSWPPLHHHQVHQHGLVLVLAVQCTETKRNSSNYNSNNKYHRSLSQCLNDGTATIQHMYDLFSGQEGGGLSCFHFRPCWGERNITMFSFTNALRFLSTTSMIMEHDAQSFHWT